MKKRSLNPRDSVVYAIGTLPVNIPVKQSLPAAVLEGIQSRTGLRATLKL